MKYLMRVAYNNLSTERKCVLYLVWTNHDYSFCLVCVCQGCFWHAVWYYNAVYHDKPSDFV